MAVWLCQLYTVYQVHCFMFLYQLSGPCGTPSSLSNGQRSYSGTTVGYTVTYTCNTGYLRTAGSSSRTCQSNGQWSGSHPTCTRKSTLCHFISFTYRLQTCKIYILTTSMWKNYFSRTVKGTLLCNSMFIPFQMHLIRIWTCCNPMYWWGVCMCL